MAGDGDGRGTDMVGHSQPERPHIEKAPHPVSPQLTRDDGRDDIGKDDHEQDVTAVLPLDERVVPEVGDVGRAGTLLRLEHHPAYVRPQQTAFGVVRVEVGVGVPMVGPVSPCPPEAGALGCACTAQE
jgi:hypothetical protein